MPSKKWLEWLSSNQEKVVAKINTGDIEMPAYDEPTNLKSLKHSDPKLQMIREALIDAGELQAGSALCLKE